MQLISCGLFYCNKFSLFYLLVGLLKLKRSFFFYTGVNENYRVLVFEKLRNRGNIGYWATTVWIKYLPFLWKDSGNASDCIIWGFIVKIDTTCIKNKNKSKEDCNFSVSGLEMTNSTKIKFEYLHIRGDLHISISMYREIPDINFNYYKLISSIYIIMINGLIYYKSEYVTSKIL